MLILIFLKIESRYEDKHTLIICNCNYLLIRYIITSRCSPQLLLIINELQMPWFRCGSEKTGFISNKIGRFRGGKLLCFFCVFLVFLGCGCRCSSGFRALVLCAKITFCRGCWERVERDFSECSWSQSEVLFWLGCCFKQWVEDEIRDLPELWVGNVVLRMRLEFIQVKC